MKKLSHAIVLICCLSSCINESDIILEHENYELSDEKCQIIGQNSRSMELTTTDAQNVAAIFQHQSISRGNPNVIKETHTITDENSNPLMYIINYENNGGYVIVSATKKHYPILAYSETGNFQESDMEMKAWIETEIKAINFCKADTSQRVNSHWLKYDFYDQQYSNKILTRAESTSPQELDWWWTEHIHDIKYTNKYEDYEFINFDGYDLTGDYYLHEDEAKQYVSMDDVYNTMAERCEASGYSAKDVIYHIRTFSISKQAGPLLSTKWGQGTPFNGAVGKRLGCATVAVGQIMNYHKHPETFQWEKINEIGSKEQQQFLKTVGVSLNIDYSTDKASADMKDIKSALNNFGYTQLTQKSNLTNLQISSEIYNNHPFLVGGYTHQVLGISSGKGHIWICDGIRYSGNNVMVITVYAPLLYPNPGGLFATDPYVPQYDMKRDNAYGIYTFWHLNWGWGDRTVDPKDFETPDKTSTWLISGSCEAPNGETYHRNTEFLLIKK